MIKKETVSDFFDIKKSIYLASRTGEKESVDTFTQDFVSQAWEAIPTLDPYEYRYRIINGDELVHGSNFTSGKDILECINPEIRRGTEYQQALNYKQAILEAEAGDTIFWTSPKKKWWEKGIDYKYTQFCVAEKVSSEDVLVRQFQSEELDSTQAAAIGNKVLGKEVFKNNLGLDKIITTVGIKKGRVETCYIQNIIQEEGGQNTGWLDFKDLEEEIKKMAKVAARKLFSAIKLGFSESFVKKTHSNLFSDIVTFIRGAFGWGFPLPAFIQTNCSLIEVSGGNFFGPALFETNTKKWCQKCKLEECCRSKCQRCGKELTVKTF